MVEAESEVQSKQITVTTKRSGGGGTKKNKKKQKKQTLLNQQLIQVTQQQKSFIQRALQNDPATVRLDTEQDGYQERQSGSTQKSIRLPVGAAGNGGACCAAGRRICAELDALRLRASCSNSSCSNNDAQRLVRRILNHKSLT